METERAPYLSGELPRPEPRPDGVDRAFWDGTRQHILRVQRCGACGESQFPPEVVCTACGAGDVGWVDVPPTGTLTSFTRVWHPVHPGLVEDDVPYLIAVVELAPGVRVVGNIVGDPHRRDLTFDMPMEAEFEDHDDAGVTLVQWRPSPAPVRAPSDA